jgi:hypothetical protein
MSGATTAAVVFYLCLCLIKIQARNDLSPRRVCGSGNYILDRTALDIYLTINGSAVLSPGNYPRIKWYYNAVEERLVRQLNDTLEIGPMSKDLDGLTASYQIWGLGKSDFDVFSHTATLHLAERKFRVLPNDGYKRNQVIMVTAGMQQKIYCYRIAPQSNKSASYDVPVLVQLWFRKNDKERIRAPNIAFDKQRCGWLLSTANENDSGVYILEVISNRKCFTPSFKSSLKFNLIIRNTKDKPSETIQIPTPVTTKTSRVEATKTMKTSTTVPTTSLESTFKVETSSTSRTPTPRASSSKFRVETSMTPTEARYISVIPNTPGAPTVITTETQSVKMTMIPSRGTTNRSVLKSSRRPSTESPTNTDQQEGRFDDDKKNSVPIEESSAVPWIVSVTILLLLLTVTGVVIGYRTFKKRRSGRPTKVEMTVSATNRACGSQYEDDVHSYQSVHEGIPDQGEYVEVVGCSHRTSEVVYVIQNNPAYGKIVDRVKELI